MFKNKEFYLNLLFALCCFIIGYVLDEYFNAEPLGVFLMTGAFTCFVLSELKKFNKIRKLLDL